VDSVHNKPSANSRTRFPGYSHGQQRDRTTSPSGPTGELVQFVQLDDLDEANLKQAGEPAFLTLQINPGNHQVVCRRRMQ